MPIAYESIKTFLRKHEGNVLRGYVPCKEKAYYGGNNREECGEVLYQSGVTVAAGLDFGQQSESDLARMGLYDLVPLVAPYLGLKRDAACEALAAKPLTITAGLCSIINDAVHEDYILRAGALYTREAGVDFADIPAQAQTVVVSLFYHLGSAASYPSTWFALCNQDWEGAAHELKTGFTRFKDRRADEGRLLERI